MEKALAIQKEVQKILGTDEVYLVGGSVRDIVMGNEAKDYDFTTPMLPEEMKERVKVAGRKAYTIGEKFGTIGFKVPYTEYNDYGGGDPGWFGPQWHSSQTFEYVEVTTFRSEVYTNKSRKPEVKFVPSLDEDLARRDFSMNAMVLKADGSIYDPFGGKLDIYKKQIVTVGLPKDRIMEDPLRMLRAARFAARYNFKIDPNFTGKARQLADRIFDVSVERWVMELDKILTSPYADSGVDALYDMGVMQRILPEIDRESLAKRRELPERVYAPEDPDMMWHFLLKCVKVPGSVKEPTRTRRLVNTGICSRLKFSNERTKKALGR